MEYLNEVVAKVVEGEMDGPIDMLARQAITLDCIFTEMLRRSCANLSEYPEAAERYMRLALKAQAHSRTTAETIAKVTRGGEQVVRHIHVDNRGGQAVIAGAVHTGGQYLLGGVQSHGTNGFGAGTALRSRHAPGDIVSLASDAERAVSPPRREESRSAEGE